MADRKPDFSGWATKNDLRCSDGRVIRHGAFAGNDGQRVPLLWQHGHKEINNVIGHAVLENRDQGVYAHGYLNSTPQGEIAKDLVGSGNVTALSIFANKLKQNGNDVVHGNIVELSLVLAGANPGAHIEHISIQHSDGEIVDDPYEAIIYADSGIESDNSVAHAEDKKVEEATEDDKDDKDDKDDDKTIRDVYDSLTEEQKVVLHYILGVAVNLNKDDDTESDDAESDDEDNVKHEDELANEGTTMSHSNVFEADVKASNIAHTNDSGETFTHTQLKDIAAEVVNFARDNKMHLKDAFAHAAKEYGISNVEVLFPNAQVSGKATWIKPEDEWVAEVVDKTSHTPFARLKSTQIDLTENQLRAKGYITGDEKKDGVFRVLSRETTPQTIYVKSKLDRDDIIDATEHDIVSYTREAMRVKFRYELAQAILVGDGREVSDREKIKEDHIRPIYSENPLYATKVVVPAGVKNEVLPERILRAQKNFKGTGLPTLFTTFDVYMDMLLSKDKADSNRRLYNSDQELCAAMRVSKIVVVDALEGVSREVENKTQDLLGILVNMADYNIGRDRGGDIFNAEDFDIDFNQYKYLMEARMSGALTEPKSAIVLERIRG